MVVLLLLLLQLARFASFGLAEIQRTKHFSNVTSNNADALRLRDILADEKYAQLLKDLRSSTVYHHHRGKRATRSPFGDGTGEIEMTTINSTPRKNTKRTKADKKSTKHNNLQTSTPPFVPSKSSASGKSKDLIQFATEDLAILPGFLSSFIFTAKFFFGVLFITGHYPLNAKVYVFNPNADSTCVFCLNEDEIFEHLLCECETLDQPTVSPTKYHYYPHNQHMYYLPECAIQQVCNAVYVRLNYTQPLCACPPRYRDPCSASLNEDDNHTLKLIGNEEKKAITLAKTCETTQELRDCRPPRDWSILALQNTRTGKSHYLVICKCPPNYRLEGPLAHDQPTYAGLPGINVYGMLCVPPQQSETQSFVSKWKDNQHFSLSSYRSKNSTITATEDEEENSVEDETKQYETTVTEDYLLDEQQTEDSTSNTMEEVFTNPTEATFTTEVTSYTN